LSATGEAVETACLASLRSRAAVRGPPGAPQVAGAAHEENPGGQPRPEPASNSLKGVARRGDGLPGRSPGLIPSVAQLTIHRTPWLTRQARGSDSAREGPRHGRRDARPDENAGARPDAARPASSALAPARHV
jgi:hypothetical protein